jgi:methionine synthase II (cobalamin-independent)
VIQISDTLTISATRLMDLAREVTLQLGEWQYHKHLVVSVNNWQIAGPSVFFTLSADADRQARLDFIDAFATAVDERVRTLPRQGGGWLMSVSYQDGGVSVGASVQVHGAEVAL